MRPGDPLLGGRLARDMPTYTRIVYGELCEQHHLPLERYDFPSGVRWRCPTCKRESDLHYIYGTDKGRARRRRSVINAAQRRRAARIQRRKERRDSHLP